MEVFRDLNNLPDFKNAVITIGSFDGVHYGHQKILHKINKLAQGSMGESVVITFHPHPRTIIYPKANDLELLSDLTEKINLLKKFGVDHVVVVPFTIEFSQQSPQEYIESFLLKKFNPKYIVIGYDHKFGLNRAGNIDWLREYEKVRDLKVVEIQKQEIEEITISSTKIRNAIKEGDIISSNQYLNHYYGIRGKVIKGKRLGNTLGYPTANLLLLEPYKLLPRYGVYAVKITLEDMSYKGMMHIGQNTEKKGFHNIEVNLFDFEGNLYDEILNVEIVDFIRDNQQFESLDLLKVQLAQDKDRSLSILDAVDGSKSITSDISIVILNYNGLSHLDSYLPFVLYSSRELVNIYVIDNGSTDNSVDYIKEWYPEIKVIKLATNHGFAEGYNRGLAKINSKYIVILNSDVKVQSYWLDPIFSLMNTDSKIVSVQPTILSLENNNEYEYAGAAGGFLDKWGYPFCRGRILDTVETINESYNSTQEVFWTSGAAMVTRTKEFKELGGFDSDFFAHQEEIDFCWRAKRAGYKCMISSDSRVYHLGGGTLSYGSEQKVFLNFRNNLIMLLKNEKTSTLIYLIPLRLILDGVAGIKFLFAGKVKTTWAIIKAHFAFYASIPKTLIKRRKIKELLTRMKHKENVTTGRYPKSIIVKYYLQGKKYFSDLDTL